MANYLGHSKSRINIDEVGRIRLSNLRDLFIKAKERSGESISISFYLQGTIYKVSYSDGSDFLSFEMMDKDGTIRMIRVFLRTERSNLGTGSVIYFLCPVTGHKCRKLFTDGRTIVSRYAFSHLYSYQRYSHRQRNLYGILVKDNDPFRKYGKVFYRGTLSRYGKSIDRYLYRMDKALTNFKRICNADL